MKVNKNLTLEESVIKRVQAYAEDTGLSLSAAFSVLATQKLNEIEAMKQMPALSDIFNKAKLLEQQALSAFNKPGQDE